MFSILHCGAMQWPVTQCNCARTRGAGIQNIASAVINGTSSGREYAVSQIKDNDLRYLAIAITSKTWAEKEHAINAIGR